MLTAAASLQKKGEWLAQLHNFSSYHGLLYYEYAIHARPNNNNMGATGSVRRSPAQMQAELERLRSKEMDLLVSDLVH